MTLKQNGALLGISGQQKREIKILDNKITNEMEEISTNINKIK